jgi:hypothetical protein
LWPLSPSVQKIFAPFLFDLVVSRSPRRKLSTVQKSLVKLHEFSSHQNSAGKLD